MVLEEETSVVIRLGKDLSNNELNIINDYRKKEFNSQSLINPQPDNEHWKKKFFLLKDKKGFLLAFARLHETEVEFKDKRFPVLGIATLVAVKKGYGFGKHLMIYMKKYIQDTGITGLGYCNKKLTEYYRRIGFGIIEDGTLKTLYRDSEGKHHHDNWGGGDAIYVEGKDNLIKEILANQSENIFIFRPHW